jgi:uncharacterized protein (DUF2062 family)
MSRSDKALGAGVLVMALCCALGPVLGAALAGGLIVGAGTAGAITGSLVLLVVTVFVSRRRRARRDC